VAAEEAKGDKAGGEEQQHRQGAVFPEGQGAEADQSLQEAVAERHLPVGDAHFVCQKLVDVPSVGLEKVFTVFQPDIFGDRFTDFTSNVKSVKENFGIMGV
jgi:hypothetical protein